MSLYTPRAHSQTTDLHTQAHGDVLRWTHKPTHGDFTHRKTHMDTHGCTRDPDTQTHVWTQECGHTDT